MSIYYVFNNYCEKKIDWYDFIISLIEKLLPTHFIFVFIYIYIYNYMYRNDCHVNFNSISREKETEFVGTGHIFNRCLTKCNTELNNHILFLLKIC